MSAAVQEVLKVELVLLDVGLLNTPFEIQEFRKAVNADVEVMGGGLLAGLPSPMAGFSHQISLNRDRIVLDLAPSLSVIRREYPEKPADVERLAAVIAEAIRATNLHGDPSAHGYNIDLTHDLPSAGPASRYLAELLFNADNLPRGEGWELLGGSGRILFGEGDSRWQVTVEPRYRDTQASKIFLNLNLHRERAEMPGADEIEESLHEVWRRAHDLAGSLVRR